MSREIIREWHFWIASMITGAGMAFSYDLIRLFRRLVRHGRFAVDLEDLLYWTACFIVSFTLLYYGNNGVIRFAAVFGAAVGMAFYAVTIGRFFVKISYWIIDKTVGSLLRIIVKIMKHLHNLLTPARRMIAGFYGRCNKKYVQRKYWLTRAVFGHKIKLCSKHKKGKGETDYGSSEAKKGKVKTKKNTRVSPREK